MEAADSPANHGEVKPKLRSSQPKCSNTTRQRNIFPMESPAPNDKQSGGIGPPNPSPHNYAPPAPLSTSVIKSEILDSSYNLPASSMLPPPKPPRTTYPMSLKEEDPLESFNAYDADDNKRRRAPSQQHSNSLARHTGCRYEGTDSGGNNLHTHSGSTDQWAEVVDDEDDFYCEKGSRQSAWNPPTKAGNAIDMAMSSKRPMSVTTVLPSAPVSYAIGRNITTIDLTEAQAKFGAQKTPISRSGDNLAALSAQDDTSSRFYRVSKNHITGPIENKIRTTERRGQVNFTKVSGNGIRYPKKWIPSTLVLIGPTLYVYKDSKGQKSSNISTKPELELHVKHLQICAAGKNYTSRENAFVLKDCTDPDNVLEYLIEPPSAELRRAWETALQYSQDFDKEDRFDRRALSTRSPPSVDQKVVTMLREFFRRRPTLESIRESGILQNEPVFGSNLIELCEKEQGRVPAFVTRVILAVEARGLETSGLYRKSGNGAVIQKLRNQVNHSEYSLNSDEWDIYELSDSLKLFLRELKEPLLLSSLYDDFKEFASAMDSNSSSQNVDKMRAILKKLPDCHYATAKMIFEHLNKVAALEKVNQMNSKNLALIFGPNMMWRDTPTDDYARFCFVGCACTDFMITNYADVFAPSTSTS